MQKVELWGYFPGGRAGVAPNALYAEIRRLVGQYGAEAVAQTAVHESGVLPVTERNPS